MRARNLPARWPWYFAVTVGIASLWALATVPSGFGVFQLLMFAGPGIVLAVSASWMAHTLSPDSWDWEDALGAALIGGTAFPPVVALFVAWSATLDANMMSVLFVLGSWLALAAGLIAGAIRALVRRRRPKRRPVVARIELLE